MFSLILILFVVLISLTVFLWIGTFFFQGYIYTQPSQQLYWQAPAAALLLTFGYAIWCFVVALTDSASTTNIPIDTLFRFSPHVDMFDRPAPKLWAIMLDRRKSAGDNKEGETVLYTSKRDDPKRFHYEDSAHRPWQRKDVMAIEIEQKDGSKLRFEPDVVGKGEYPRFISKDGWVMPEYETGPNGLPQKFRLGRLIVNLLFNFGHLLAWFLGLWVILRFQWTHALGFAVVLWVISTLVILPMLLTYAGSVAASRATPAAWLGALPLLG